MSEFLRLDLRQRSLVFPDGKPFCLICGAAPAGTRQVWFEDLDSTKRGAVGLEDVGEKGTALGLGVNALRRRITFDAPLCGVHLRSARFHGLKAAGLFLLTVAVLVGGILIRRSLQIPKHLAQYADWAPFIPAIIPAALTWMVWTRKDRAGLPCDVLPADGAIVLTYKDKAPVSAG